MMEEILQDIGWGAWGEELLRSLERPAMRAVKGKRKNYLVLF
jgi:hypothetical protein